MNRDILQILVEIIATKAERHDRWRRLCGASMLLALAANCVGASEESRSNQEQQGASLERDAGRARDGASPHAPGTLEYSRFLDGGGSIDDGSATSWASGSYDPGRAVDDQSGRARLFVLTDIGNEPDDQESLVRLLLYANEIDIEGIVAVTSNWKTSLDEASQAGWNRVVDAYEQVQQKLSRHDPSYPTAAALRTRFALGQPSWGLEGMGTGQPVSDGAKALIAAADAQDPRPLWVSVWGGPNTLAEALWYVREQRSAEQVDAFVRKLRVYSISDQDPSGPWIREQFQELFYVVSLSSDAPGYANATWTGISGEGFWRPTTFALGADPREISADWLEKNIRAKGALGAAYPPILFIMEGDTPSWLWLVSNGLAGTWNPNWGGWGGRYAYRQPNADLTSESRPIFTNGSCATWLDPGCTLDGTSADTVIGYDGQVHTDDFATIYRWRDAYQHDFANRMDWTVKDVDEANHAPSIVLNGETGVAPVCLLARTSAPIALSASGSSDRDGDALTFSWLVYPEAGRAVGEQAPAVVLSRPTGERTSVAVTEPGEVHLILTATDDGGAPRHGSFEARSYRRIVLTVRDDANEMPTPTSCGSRRL